MKFGIRSSNLNIFQNGEKQGINFKPNHRDIYAWNCYLFKHPAFFVQRPRQTPGNYLFSRGTGLFKRKESAENA